MKILNSLFLSFFVFTNFTTTAFANKKLEDEYCESTNECPLISASEKGDLATVRQLVESGISVDIRDLKNKHTALMIAAEKNYPEIAAYLIEHHADMELKDGNQLTALHITAQKNSVEVAEVLVSAGANVNTEDRYKVPVLYRATWNENAGVVKALLKGDVNIDYQLCRNQDDENEDADDTCLTALHLSIEMFSYYNNIASKAIALDLIQAGANVKLLTRAYKRQALSYFSNKLDLEIIKALVNAGADIQLRDRWGNKPFDIYLSGSLTIEKDPILTQILKLFISKGLDINDYYLFSLINNFEYYPATTAALIEAGADVNITFDKDQPINRIAAGSEEGHLAALKLLYNAGANPGNIGSSLFTPTPLMVAASKGYPTVAKFLLEHGADKNAINIERRMASQLARSRGDAKLAQFISNFGIQIESLPPFKDTGIAIIDAVKANNITRVKELISEGVNIDQADSDKSSALMWAASLGLTDIVKELLAANANTKKFDQFQKNALMWAAYNGKTETVSALLSKSNIDQQSPMQPADEDGNFPESGHTALMYAIDGGDTKTLVTLLSAGAKVNLMTTNGNTALSRASGRKIEMLKLLIEAGADLSSGPSVLVAAARTTTPDLEFMKLLIAKNIDVNKKGAYGFTALLWSGFYGNMDAVKLLLEAGADKTILSDMKHDAAYYARRENHPEVADYIDHF